MIKIYGIKNCDTVKKAINWLEANNVKYQFHDYKKVGADKETLQRLIQEFGVEKIINRKGTTWRKLSLDEQSKINDQESALKLMMENTSIIKRPIIDLGAKFLLGFDEVEWRKFIL